MFVQILVCSNVTPHKPVPVESPVWTVGMVKFVLRLFRAQREKLWDDVALLCQVSSSVYTGSSQRANAF